MPPQAVACRADPGVAAGLAGLDRVLMDVAPNRLDSLDPKDEEAGRAVQRVRAAAPRALAIVEQQARSLQDVPQVRLALALQERTVPLVPAVWRQLEL